jgi:hypothetical protein
LHERLHLATRYYTCPLVFRILPSTAFSAPHADEWADALRGAEAAVILLDASEAAASLGPALLLATAWAERLAGGAGAPSTLLILSNKLDVLHYAPGGSALPDAARAHLDTVRAWALSNEFEHVEAVATAPLEGAALREKSSVPRVLEALESTMWTAMTRRGGGKSSAISAASALPAASSGAGAAAGAGAVAGEEGSAAAAGAGETVAPTAAEALAAGPLATEPPLDEDDIGRLMELMRGVKMAAQQGGLSDGARREAAADMALRLLALIGGEDGEEEVVGEELADG